ncbi:hypothetical protein ACQKWADRAFT_296247 [Trichoderma austrokoningii]
MEFVQCQTAINSGMNIKCMPIRTELYKFSTNYCPGHLVYPTAQRSTFRNNNKSCKELFFLYYLSVSIRIQF